MRRAELGVVAALAALALVAALLVPTYPNYDTYFHLVWGRELMHGMKPDFEAYAAPTEHPLFLALCALVGLVGTDGERLIVLVCVLSLVALVWATFRVGDACFGPWPALAGAVFVGSSFAFLLYAARAYVDVPFLALVLWAAALEARAPRRGLPVMATLAVAGLLRPEAWVLAGAYWLWCGWRRLDLLALAVAAPLAVVPGRPLGHRRSALLAARHQRPRRRAQPQPRAVLGPGLVRVVRDRHGPPAGGPRRRGGGAAAVAAAHRACPARADRAVRRRRGHLPGHRAGRALGPAALPHDPGGGRLPGRRLRRARVHDAARGPRAPAVVARGDRRRRARARLRGHQGARRRHAARRAALHQGLARRPRGDPPRAARSSATCAAAR